MRANYHTHCDFCDGQTDAARMAAAAAAAGYQVLGFSSHAPVPWPTDWCMDARRVDAYADEVRRLGRVWADKGLEVLLGLEIDWLPDRSGPADAAFARLGLDFRLGSVHYVFPDGAEPFCVDEPADVFAAHLAAAGLDGEGLWREYYRRLGELVDAGGFEILGHFDLVRRNNAGGRYFDEESPDYLKAALGVAAQLEGSPVVVEVNLGGLARGKLASPYPSLSVLRELRHRGVRITFCADAHAPAHLGAYLETARELARAAGYRSVAVLSGGSWREVGLDQT
jgi:histidinol-phosphatase (PHP family)